MVPGKGFPSNMVHNFSNIPKVDLPRSAFKRTHTYKTTFNAADLVPFFVDMAYPGDTFNLKVTCLARISSPLKFPIMDNMYMDTFFFAVPLRLIHDNWEKLNGAQDNPGDSTDFMLPIFDVSKAPISTTGWTVGSLSDYFGIPLAKVGLVHNSVFHRAYNLIWNDWFRDSNLQDSVVVDTDDGPDDPADYVLLKRGKRHDYFTSCLPWPQKTDSGEGVLLPLGTSATVWGLEDTTAKMALQKCNSNLAAAANVLNSNSSSILNVGSLGTSDMNLVKKSTPGITRSGLYADLSEATAATINSIREAFQLQRLYERDARGGTRYVEIIKSHFGTISPDFRLQRPEYLGGSNGTSVLVSPIVQTSESNTTKQGNLSAIGTVVAQSGFVKSFVEHCLIIGLVNVRADLTYQQGLSRMFTDRERFDFYWPSLAHIGEQPVLNKEIWCNADANDDLVFGYQEAWAHLRYYPSKITGKLRSDVSGTLDAWHLSQDFATLPVLNDEFIQDSPPMSRVKAVTTEPDFIFDSFFTCNTVRPLPMYSVPGYVDHF